MRGRPDLRKLGLRRSPPLPADHSAISEPCVLCERPLWAGDRAGVLPAPDSEEWAPVDGLICHWTCIEDALNRLQQRSEIALGATRRFLESWDASFKPTALVGDHLHSYNTEADFILKNGRAFERRELPGGLRSGRPRECFRNAARLALRKPDLYTYVEGYAINRWVAIRPVAHAWCIDPADSVVDTTWEDGVDYFGVPFRHGYLRRVLDAKRDFGLIDNPEMSFPLVTGAHSAEEAVARPRPEAERHERSTHPAQ